ncbi:hypothetical protein BDY21DRAFT_342152 [Lineolata rhizophorae]|uniref:Cora-like Mg2+ transporter protein-domain-containing protein n=1 Tax=Lineolata rhizophorae TaxID=578093 RepID=A0A6A6P349_9PEZI|nr:hypothetical protein BDY21DRAFT_342152 [Lineolata rhizophorae]
MFNAQVWEGNACFTEFGDQDHPTRISIFHRDECGWNERFQITSVVDFSSKQVTYLVIGCPESSLSRIKTGAVESQTVLHSLLGLDTLLLDDCFRQWKQLINRYRAELLDYEYEDPEVHGDMRAAKIRLHNLCSDLHRLCAHLGDFIERGDFLVRAYAHVHSCIKAQPGQSRASWIRLQHARTDEMIAYLISSAKTCRAWAQDYLGRANTRENIVWHFSAQRNSNINEENSRINIGIASLTRDIAKEAHKDSRAMVALNVLAVAFLPGTFVAGIFSMVFFTSSDGSPGFHTSGWLWLYFIITVPLTAVTFFAWRGWRRRTRRKDLDSEEAVFGSNLSSSESAYPLGCVRNTI